MEGINKQMCILIKRVYLPTSKCYFFSPPSLILSRSLSLSLFLAQGSLLFSMLSYLHRYTLGPARNGTGRPLVRK